MKASGLLIIVALFLIYLAATGKYPCVTAAAQCLFGGKKLCECGPEGAKAGSGQGQTGPDLIRTPIETGRQIYEGIKERIRRARGQ